MPRLRCPRMGYHLIASTMHLLNVPMSRYFQVALAAILAVTLAQSQTKKPDQSLSTVSKQPDEVLFLRTQQFFRVKKYEQGITTLQVLFNTYPDSPYVARSKRLLAGCPRNRRCAAACKQSEGSPKAGCMDFLPSGKKAPDTNSK